MLLNLNGSVTSVTTASMEGPPRAVPRWSKDQASGDQRFVITSQPALRWPARIAQGKGVSGESLAQHPEKASELFAHIRGICRSEEAPRIIICQTFNINLLSAHDVGR